VVKKVQVEKESESPEEKKKKDKVTSGKNFDLKKSFEDLKKYLKESFSELKKIHWPTRRQVFGETVVVIITVVFFSILVLVFDKILSGLFNYILNS
jgi:preprotein translocase subunit SecE